MRYKPRRAMKEPFVDRARRHLRIIVPGIAALALVGGIGAASVAGPTQATGQIAVPGASTSTPLTMEREIGTSRQSGSRAPLAGSSSGSTPTTPAPGAPTTSAASPTTPADVAKAKPTPTPPPATTPPPPAATTPPPPAKPVIKEKRWTTALLNLRVTPSEDADVVGEVKKGSEIGITGRTDDGFTEVVYGGAARWVTSDYLSRNEPRSEQAADDDDSDSQSAGSDGQRSTGEESDDDGSDGEDSGSDVDPDAGAPCASGSSVEKGLKSNTIKAHRYICARWPQIKSFGGVRADSLPEHPSGRALDVMTNDSDLGWEIAKYMRAHASEFGISQVIYQQKIWTTQRSGEGWRGMSDRGGSTANHMDHVHLSFR